MAPCRTRFRFATHRLLCLNSTLNCLFDWTLSKLCKLEESSMVLLVLTTVFGLTHIFNKQETVRN